MSRVLSGIGLLAFAAVSAFHFLSLWRVAGYYLPALALLFAVFLILVWLGGLALILYAIKRNKLRACLAVVFLYVMTIILTGTRVLDGVPAEISEGKWHDPDHRLTPGAKYLLHNHSNVARVLSQAEYRLYMNYGICYFSAGFMLLAACFCLYPLDSDGQLQHRRNVIRTIELPAPAATARCPNCSGEIPADASGHWPPWCPHCGADSQVG